MFISRIHKLVIKKSKNNILFERRKLEYIKRTRQYMVSARAKKDAATTILN